MSNTPSDAEIEALAQQHLKAFVQFSLGEVWFEGEVEFARAVLARWGSPQPVAREPLTDEQLAEMMRDTWGCASIAPRHALEFARAVERAHGITQKRGALMHFGSVCSGIEAASVRGSKPYQQSAAALPDGMRVKAPTRDIAGQRFGRLVARQVVGKSKANSLIWLCNCDCGATVERTSASLKKSKGVSSCGCYLKEVSKERLASSTPWNKGKTYATKKDSQEYANKKAWAEAVLRIKGNKCERCGWAEARCDVHHITPRAEGGKNFVSNGVVLCPNCHRVAHEQSGGGGA